MIYGLDTSFLVQFEVMEQAGHREAHQLKKRLLREKATFALAPQTLCEFLHIVTDPKRFERPLKMNEAIQISEVWWNLKEVSNITPTATTVPRFHRWVIEHRLGRKRLLDTLLAATFEAHHIENVITSDPKGFQGFKIFNIIDPLDE